MWQVVVISLRHFVDVEQLITDKENRGRDQIKVFAGVEQNSPNIRARVQREEYLHFSGWTMTEECDCDDDNNKEMDGQQCTDRFYWLSFLLAGHGNLQAHPDFQLFATRRTVAGTKMVSGCASFLDNLWTRVTLETLPRSELLQLIAKRQVHTVSWSKLSMRIIIITAALVHLVAYINKNHM